MFTEKKNNLFFMSVVNGIVSRGMKLQQKVTLCQTQKKLSTERVLKQWNVLSVEISGTPLLVVFKNSL